MDRQRRTRLVRHYELEPPRGFEPRTYALRERPTDLVDLVDRLTLLQIDPTAAIAPNAHLIAWSRLGRPTSLPI